MEWKRTESDTEPKQVDITSSPHMVYMRRNITKKTRTIEMSESEKQIEYYEYEECQMTKEQYEQQQASLSLPSTQMIMQSISDLELSIAMIGVE